MKHPNFIIVGAPKAGTTALASYLNQHPDIYISPQKEPHYFTLEGHNDRFEGPLDDIRVNMLAIREIERYKKLFKNAGNSKIVGEASTSYLASTKAPLKIAAELEDVLLVAVLRNPVDRAFSDYLFYKRDGGEPCETFEEALADEDSGRRDKWWSGRYRSAGLYSGQVKRYLDLFREERFKVILFDDIQEDIQKVMKDLYQTLGVDDSFIADTKTRHNISGIPQSKTLHQVHGFLASPNRLKTYLLKPLLSEGIRRFIRKNLLNMIRNINLRKATMEPETQRALTEYYREDIIKLQDLIKRDLSEWLSSS